MAEIFDAVAVEYDNWYETPLGALVDKVEWELILKMLDPQPGQKVLDFGCGTGIYALRLAQKGLKVTGLDISGAMLEQAQRKSRKNGLKVNFIQGDARKLPFADNTCDAAVSVTAFEFMPEPLQVIQEALRVIKPQGKVVIAVIGGSSPWSAMYEQKARTGHPIFCHAKFYTPDEMRQFLPENIVEVKAALYFPPETENFDVKKALEIEERGQVRNSSGAGFVCGVWRKNS